MAHSITADPRRAGHFHSNIPRKILAFIKAQPVLIAAFLLAVTTMFFVPPDAQYIGYCKVFDEQRKLHDNGVTAAKETYRICIEKGYLADYMRTHEKEVISMMQELFDEETLRKQLETARSKRDFEQGKSAVAKNLILLGNMSPEDIAKVSDLTVETVKELSAQMAAARS